MTTSELSHSLDPLRARFRDLALEKQYARDHVVKWKRAVVVILCLGAVLSALLARSDRTFFSGQPFLPAILWIRAGFLAFAIACITVIARTRSARVYENTLFVLVMASVFVTLWIDLSRPPDYYLHFIVDLILIFAFQILIPNRIEYQVIPAAGMTAGSLLILFLVKNLTPSAETAIGYSFMLSFAAGVWFSWHHHRTSRLLYFEMREERRLHAELRAANEHIKQLTGVLPICAWCKNIRDEQGQWQQLETYIVARSEADFTHGLCPACAEKHYPETFKQGTPQP